MDLRPVTVSLLLLGTTALAQVPTPAPTPAPAPAKPATQDPDKPQATPDQTIQELSNERDRLLREITYAKDRAKNGKALLAERLAPKPQSWKAIDAGTGTPTVQPMVPVTPRQARLATPEELNAHGTDTLLVVNGRGVQQRAFDNLMAYLASNPASGDETARAKTSLFELIKLEAIAAIFGENESLERVGEILTQLEKGKAMADLAKSVGAVPGADADGKVTVKRNSTFGPMFEQVAFGTEVGKRARPFRSTNGLVILQVDAVTKGERPELDKVAVSTILVPYTPDAQQLQKAHTAVNEGQVDVWVRDQKTLEALPMMFRRPAPTVMSAPLVSPEAAALQKQLGEWMKELGTLQGKTDDASKAKVQEIGRQIGETETKLRALRAAATINLSPDGDATKVDEVVVLRAALGQIAAQIADLEKEGSEAAKAKIKVLQEQYSQVKARIKGAEGSDEAPVEIRGPAKPPAKKD